jgi:hypothetical protein
MVVWAAVAVVVALAGAARASHEGMLDKAGLKKAAEENKALSRYLKYNGLPDAAEVKPIIDQPPWDDHEVTLYYLKSRKEISFARARVLGRPDVCSTRYERVLTDADIRTLSARAKLDTTAAEKVDVASACTGNAATRAECSAGRAERAADRVDMAATRAEKAADRTEAVVEKMSAASVRTKRHK